MSGPAQTLTLAWVDWLYLAPVLAAGLLAGGSTGALGVFIVGMRVPFLAVCVSHAALAGAVFGSLAGLTGQMLLLPALGASLLAAATMGFLDVRRSRMDPNVLMGLMFSLTMGLAFLGIGLHGAWGRSDSEVRNLLWGSVLFCRWEQVGVMAAGAALGAAVVGVFWKELRAVLFCRDDAAAAGIPAGWVWASLLAATAAVLTVNFQTVGGLMIYALVTNPAAAAFLVVRGFGRSLATAAAMGAFSGAGGLAVTYLTDLPPGAMIVILSATVVAAAWGVSLLRR